jgi:hypothetical protein
MKHLLLTLLLATLCATGHGQTIKSLGYNTTNGNVVYTGTNVLTFTNNIGFSSGRIEIGQGLGFWDDADGSYALFFQGDDPVILNSRWNDSGVRSALGLGWPALTNTNAATSLLGLDVSNQVIAATNIIFTNGVAFTTNAAAATLANLGLGTNASVTISNLNAQSISITNADTFRTNIGIPLPALTNTSNVTIMRALAGSTNTNEPFSGLFEFKDSGDGSWAATVSNGIIIKIEEQ